MKLEVSHSTTYSYRLPVAQSHHAVHLEPRPLPRQSVIHHSLLIDPAPVTRSVVIDDFGNPTLLLRIDEEHTEFGIHARSTVELVPPPQIDLDATCPWEHVQELARRPNLEFDADVLQFTCRSRQTPISRDLLAFVKPLFPAGRPVLVGAMELTRRIFNEFKFDPAATDISTPISRVLEMRRGVCQDFAHLSIAALRALGVPARYVSGYLLTRPPPGQSKLKGADASHAWLSVWAPETGWVDFDPTNGIMPSTEHVTVAYGRDYDDVCPISGILLGGADQRMTVAVDVEPAI
jgi:transglutaminase-like putative cysteine protease